MARAAMLTVIGCVALTACATPYQQSTWWNNQGVSGKQVSSDTLLVSARGNMLTSQDRIQEYVIRKAAEMTVAAGNDWFAPMTSQDRTRTGAYISSFGRSAFAFPIVEPGASMMVKMGKGPRPDGAMDARDVLAFAVEKPAPAKTP